MKCKYRVPIQDGTAIQFIRIYIDHFDTSTEFYTTKSYYDINTGCYLLKKVRMDMRSGPY